MRIEACGDRVIHVVASPTSEIPNPKVPIVTQTCRANNLQVKAGKKETQLSTAAITISVNAATGAVSFFSKDGKAVLAEPAEGGKTFDVPSVAEMKTWQVQQSFLSPSDEAQYGLGQHQDGIFNVRGVPIRLHQANTTFDSVSAVQQGIWSPLEQSFPDRLQSGRPNRSHRSNYREGQIHHRC